MEEERYVDLALFDEVTQAIPAAPEEAPALVEEEAASTREAPRHISVVIHLNRC